jgi:hypothetical protein
MESTSLVSLRSNKLIDAAAENNSHKSNVADKSDIPENEDQV